MALSSGRNTPTRKATTVVIPMAANVKIFEGSLVVVDAGYAKPGIEGEGLITIGRAEEYVDNTGGLAGAKAVKVRRGCFLFNNDGTTPVTNADLFKDCYVVDDETVTSDATGRSIAGKVIEIDSDGIWVEIV